MAIETFEFIDDLNAANPTATDNVSEGDDHLRGLKTTLKNTFPNVTGAINATETELNYVDGVTSNIQTQLGTKLPLAGGTMTGNLLLETSGNPSITNKTTGSGNNPTFRLQADTHYWDFQGTFSNANDELMFMYDGSSKLELTSAGDVNVKTGNLVIGTSGKGIDFSADGNAAGMTSEVLDDYEEGTWTPTFALSSGSVTYTTQTGNYTKIGRKVTAVFHVVINVSTSGVFATLESLPFTAANNNYGGTSFSAFDGTFSGYSNLLGLTASGGTAIQIRGADVANSNPSVIAPAVTNGTVIAGTITYFT